MCPNTYRLLQPPTKGGGYNCWILPVVSRVSLLLINAHIVIYLLGVVAIFKKFKNQFIWIFWNTNIWNSWLFYLFFYPKVSEWSIYLYLIVSFITLHLICFVGFCLQLCFHYFSCVLFLVFLQSMSLFPQPIYVCT